MISLNSGSLKLQVRLNRTLKSLQEFYNMDEKDESRDSILEEEVE
jgi:hypothetical protein